MRDIARLHNLTLVGPLTIDLPFQRLEDHLRESRRREIRDMIERRPATRPSRTTRSTTTNVDRKEGPLSCSAPGISLDYTATARLYSQVAGVLAGFAFIAILLVTRNALRDQTKTTGREVTAFAAAFFGFILAAVEYAVMAGESGRPETSGRLAIEFVINGVAFAVSILALLYGVVLILQSESRLSHAANWAERVTGTLGPMIVVLLLQPGVRDIENARSDKPSPSIVCDGTGGWQLVGYIVVIVSITSLVLLRVWRDRLPVLSMRGQTVSSYVLALTVIAGSVSYAISIIYDYTIAPPYYMSFLLIAASATALTLFSFLVLAARPETDNRTMSERGGCPIGSELTRHGSTVPLELSLNVDAAVTELVSRARNQGSGHWHEFSIIVAGANVLSGLVLTGKVVELHPRLGVVALASAGITLASAMAVMLAYYSIQVGALLIFGPLQWTQVLTSFLIAGTQLALFLWPVHVITNSISDSNSTLRDLCYWLLFFAAFALSAFAANADAARMRRREGVDTLSKKYESAQRRDMWATLISCVVTLLLFLISLWMATVGLFLGIAFCVITSLFGMASQSRTVAGMMGELPRVTIQKEDG